MRTSWLCGACVLVLAAPAGALAQRRTTVDVEVQFKSAQQKELVDGDLKAAIEQYTAVVARAGANRALAAQALLRIAECHQKQGDAEARQVYERVVREYPEQKDAVLLAQRRLAGATRTVASDGALALRKVWTGDLGGTVSPDGRLLSFVDWTSGNLMLHDFASGADRVLTDNPPGRWPASNNFAEESAISRDGSRIAYAWYDAKLDRYVLRLADTQKSGAVQKDPLFSAEDVAWIAPYEWSPDGASLAVVLQRKDRSGQIGLVSVRDGSLHVLKSVDWRGPTKMFFSPDGRFLAYDLPIADTTAQRDVFVLAVDGSREVAAVQHPAQDRTMGWSPNGEFLLFASDRSGTFGVWGQPMTDAQPRGAPVLLKGNVGGFWSLGVTTTGALYMGLQGGDADVEIATVDLQTGTRLGASTRPIKTFVGSNQAPVWSPDGRFLAYRTARGTMRNGEDLLAVLDLETGKERIVPLGLQTLRSVSWSPDGSLFLLSGKDFKGRTGLFRADVPTGRTTPLALQLPIVGTFPEWSLDGKRIYYRNRGPWPERADMAVIERDIASGTERVMTRGPFGATIFSPDRRWIAVTTADRAHKVSRILLVSTDGATQRELLAVTEPRALDNYSLAWVPDGRGLVVRERLDPGGSKNDFWFVPVDGGEPRRLDIDVSGAGGPFSVHPDGHRIAFWSGEATTEVWVLEHFLPTKPR